MVNTRNSTAQTVDFGLTLSEVAFGVQQPKGGWQKPGAIQVPKGIQAIRTQDDKCQRRLIVGAGALFEFNKATLTPDALETLNALSPTILKSGKHPVMVEGHTDSNRVAGL